MLENIYRKINERTRQIALLIDPEKALDSKQLAELVKKAEFAGIHYFFVGGSTVLRSDVERVVTALKQASNIPVVLFPGASHQLSQDADALLFLNLISGRNPDFLIGHHVQCAEEVDAMDIEVIPTSYILVDGGKMSSVAYISQTTPIPRDQANIILKTALAGQLMGQRLTYLDAGSGALEPVSENVIRLLRSRLKTPIIVGGGIKNTQTMEQLAAAGANILVIGNKIEENIDFLLDIKSFIADHN
ncbi:MAG: geranylgeranylglyceryl/heptaprenylglyceryl phosphate synthase [Fluviicola sp.]